MNAAKWGMLAGAFALGRTQNAGHDGEDGFLSACGACVLVDAGLEDLHGRRPVLSVAAVGGGRGDVGDLAGGHQRSSPGNGGNAARSGFNAATRATVGAEQWA